MKNKFILGMVAVTLLQAATPALANQTGARRPAPYTEPPLPLPPPPPPGYGDYYGQEGSVEIQSISRRSGGEWYRISLRRPVRLDRVEVTALSQRLKIHEASVVTESRSRIQIREFANTPVFGVGSRAVSENLNLRERVLVIDIRAESYGGFADARVSAVSSEERPQLVVGEVAPPNPGPGHGQNGCYNRNDISRELRSMGANLDTWLGRMNNATYGSVEYNMASQEAQAIGRRMVDLANSQRAQKSPLASLEKVGAEALQKMNTYTYGSTAYNTYNKVAVAVFAATEGALSNALSCEVRTTDELLNFGASFITKMNSFTYGSTPYNAYNKLVLKTFELAPDFYAKEVARTGKSFRMIDEDMEKYNRTMNSFTYGSTPYNSYGKLVQKAVELSEQRFRQFAPRLGANERFELVRFYESKRNSFTYGSVIYNHYSRMKEIAANGR